jgi:hypothetical protein
VLPPGRPVVRHAGGPPIRRFLLLIAVLGTAAIVGPAVASAREGNPPAPDAAVNEVALADAATPGFTETLATDDATSLVGLKWNGTSTAEFTIEVQQDDGTWTTPYSVEGMDIGPDTGTPEARKVAERRGQDYITEPLAVSDPSKVRVRVADGLASDVEFVTVGGGAATPTDEATPPPTEPVPSTTTPDSTTPPAPSDPPPPPSSTSPGATEAGVLTWTGAGLLTVAALGWLVVNRRRMRRVGVLVILAVVAIVAVGCTTPAPPPPPPPPETGIHSRAEWGGPNVGACAGYTDPVTYGIVHHTGGGPADNDYTNPAAKINGIYNYHVTSGGYCDIAYNFLIDKWGGIWEGRAGGVTNAVMGAHTLGHNSNSFGVAVLGDFTYIDPGDAAKNAVVALFAWKFSIHGVHPTGLTNNEVWAHRELNATACPGDLFYDDLPWIRSQVVALVP